MATPSPAQLERLKSVGADPSRYDKLPQAAFDKLFPDEATVTAQPAPAPIAGGEETVGLETPEFAAEPGRVEPVDLGQERSQFIDSRSRDPLGTLQPEREAAAVKQADAILDQSFTTGGKPTPFGIFQPVVDYVKDDLGGSELMQAFTPQTIQTPEQTQAQKRREMQASQLAAQSLLEEYQMSRVLADRAGNQKAVDIFNEKIATLKGLATDDPQYTKRRREIIETGRFKRSGPLPDKAGDYKEFGTQVLQSATTSPGPGGGLVESPALYSLRTLAAPISAAAGVGERVGEEVLERAPILFPGPSESVRKAAQSDQDPILSTIAQRVAEGTAVMGAGADIADFAAEAAGLSPKLQEETTDVTRYIGGGAGLLVDFALKPIPGSGAVTSAVKTGAQARSLGRALSLPRTSAVATGVKAGLRRGVSDVGALIPGGRKVKLKGRYIFPEFAEGDVYADTLARYAGDAGKQGDAAVFLTASARLEKKGLLDDWGKLTPDKRRAKLVEELGERGAADFEKIGKEFGLDVIDEPRDFIRLQRTSEVILRRASLSDSLSEASKRQLARGEALTSDKALGEMADYGKYLVSEGGTAFDDFMSSLSPELKALIAPRFVNDIDNLNQIAGTTFKDVKEYLAALPKKRGFKALTDLGDDAQRAVLKQFLIDAGNTKLRQVSPKLLPNFTRITRNSFLPDSQVAPAVDEFNKLFGKLRDSAVEQIEQAAKAERADSRGLGLVFKKEDFDAVKELLDNTSVRFEDETFDILEELAARLERANAFDDGVLVMSPQEFNGLLNHGLDIVASKQPGYKTLRNVADDLRSISDTPTASMDLEFYRSKILTPKELAGGSIENVAKGAGKATIRKTITGGEPTAGNPMSEEFISEIGQKFGAIEEDFKRRYRQARALLKAEGKPSSPPEAWAKVISENYVRSDVDVPNSGIDDFFDLSYGQMFDDYVSQVYGGYESVVDALNASGRTQFLDGMLVNPAEMRQLVKVMLQHDDFVQLRRTFIKLQRENKNIEALTVLRDTHAYIQGKPIQSFIKDADELKDFYTAAAFDSEVDDIAGYGHTITKPYETGGFRQDDRGLLEIWDNAKESAPMFLMDDHVKLLSTQYSTRRMAGIVEEVFDDWARTYPELFPTNKGIKSQGYRLYRNWGMRYSMNLDGALEALQGRAGKNNVVMFMNPDQSPILHPTTVRINKRLELRFPKIYIAIVEDYLTNMSGSTQKAGRLGYEIRNLKKEIGDIIAEDVMFKNPNATKKEIQNAKDFILGKPAQGNNPAIESKVFPPGSFGFLRRNSGASTYIDSIYPSLRAETTPLFYNTLKTAIKQAAASNRQIIRTGVLESTLRAPLALGETSSIRSAVIGKANIDQFTETMMEMAIGSQFRKASPELAKSLEEGGSLTEKIQRGIDATTELRGQATKRGTRLVNVVNDLVGTPGAAFNDGRFSRIAKGGVLGGNLLPNFRYLTTNYGTAPAIVYGSLGLDYGGAALKATIFDGDSHAIMRALTGQGNFGAKTFIAGGDFSPSYSYAAERVLFVHPTTGKAYTNYELARIAGENGITRSQASAELTEDMVKEFVSYSGIEAEKLKGVKPQLAGGNLKAAYRGGLKQTLKEDLFPAYFGNRQMNMFSEMANLTDGQFRLAVFAKALRNGETEANALLLARESLFDYGNLSAFEKGYINKVMWFWTFRRNSYRQVMKSFLSNPERMKNSYLANNYFREMDRDYTHDTVDYAKSRPFMALIDNKESKQRYSIYGPGIPQLQATADLMDYLTAFPVIAEMSDVQSGRKQVSEGMSDFIKDGTLGIASQARPSIQFIVAMSFGVDPSRDARRLGTYLDPRLMWYLQQNPDAWSTFSSMVNVEAVEREDEKPSGGYYQGRQWRLKRGDDTSARNWYLMQQVLLTIGLQRTARDYAPALEALRQGVAGMPEEQRDIRLGGTSERGAIENLLYTGGVITPIEAPNLQTRIRYNERVLRDALREDQ